MTFDVSSGFAEQLFKSANVIDSLNSFQCATHDNAKLFAQANLLAEKADSFLMPKYFSRVAQGILYTVIDEEDGIKDGGGTNTFGSYGAFLFKGTEIFPDGACDIPAAAGTARCSDSSITFFLGPSDVIALLACSPPPMKYFSYDVYITTRITQEYPFYPGQNFGDTISYYDLNTSSNTGNVFNEPVLIIHSADKVAADTVADAFINVGAIDSSAISVRGITGETVRLWNRSNGINWKQSKPDYLSMESRYTAPLNGYEAEYESYKKQVWPVRFYFSDDNAKSTTPMNPSLKSRYSPSIVNEIEVYSDGFELFKNNVITMFSKSYNCNYLKSLHVNLTTEGFYDDWDYVLSKQNNDSFALGNRDAIYGIPTDGGGISSRNAYVMVGLLHADIFNASYHSIGYTIQNDTYPLTLETKWFLESSLVGSARRYDLSGNNSIFDNFFAIDVLPPGKCSFSSNPQWCVEVNQTSVDALNNPYVLFDERIYGVYETTVGPAANITIPSQMLEFHLSNI
eukprot:gene6554-9003_t